MKSSDIFLATMIILIFLICNVATVLVNGIDEIINNWPKYRCNPLIIPFAGFFGHNPAQNFAFCIAQMQKDMMGVFTAPIEFGQSVMLQGYNQLSSQMNSLRDFQSVFKNTLGFELFNIFGLFENILIQFQKFIINIRDMMNKLIGTMIVFMSIMQGTHHTGMSFVNGPIYGTIKTISDIAF